MRFRPNVREVLQKVWRGEQWQDERPSVLPKTLLQWTISASIAESAEHQAGQPRTMRQTRQKHARIAHVSDVHSIKLRNDANDRNDLRIRLTQGA